MKNTYLFTLIIISVILLTLTGCKRSEKEETSVPTVDVAEAYTDSIVIYETYPGLLGSITIADVVARVDGTILSKNFTSGSFVKKGQILYTIESSKYKDAVQQAEASLLTARSQHNYYTRQYAAMQKALAADAVSKMEVLQAENNMKQAAAAVCTAEAALSTARENLSYCVVRAPISGQISGSEIDPGNVVNGAGSPVKLSTIYDNNELIAKFSLSDAQYEQLVGRSGGLQNKIYRTVPLTFRESLLHKYTTDLYYEAPTVNSSTGAILMQGHVFNKDNELKNGMYVTVSLPVGVLPNATLVKDAAISTDQRGKYLYTVNDSNKVVYTSVEVGPTYQDTLRVIKSGIKPGTRYITKALLTVREGEQIKPKLIK